MSTFLSRHDNISNEMSLLLDRISTPGLEAARSTSLLKQMSTSCLTQLTKETSNGQVERGYFVADDTPKDFEYSQKRRSRTRSSNGLSSPVAKYEFSKRQKCLSWCNCACHIKGNFSSPRTLSALFGELRVQYNGRSRLPCNCSPSSSFSVSYRFPQYLLLRYVLLVVYLNQIAGPEYLLRVPRVLPPSHRLWHYSINGDIMAVQNMYSQGLASPYDVNMKNGPAIFYAVEQETPEFAHFLLDQGVDFDIPNTAGLTAGELLWDRLSEAAMETKDRPLYKDYFKEMKVYMTQVLLPFIKLFLGSFIKTFEPYLRHLRVRSMQLTLGAGPHSIGLYSAMTRLLFKICWVTARTQTLLTGRVSSLLILLEVPRFADLC